MYEESSSFPRILSLLRKEKNISQKEASSALGISQALLSHYEKGIRRPNLDFLVRCADYYGVSCDYLLGRSSDREGVTITVDEIPNPESAGKGNVGIDSVLSQLNKKLISNSLNILFDLLTKLGNKTVTTEISNFLMLAVYKMFRVVYKANRSNQDAMFDLPESIYKDYAGATMQVLEANANAITTGHPLHASDKIDPAKAPKIDTETLNNDYPLFASSLLNLIQTSEKRIDYKGKNKR